MYPTLTVAGEERVHSVESRPADSQNPQKWSYVVLIGQQ